MHKTGSRILLGLSAGVIVLVALLGSPGLTLRALGLRRQGTVEMALSAAPAGVQEVPTGDPLGAPVESVVVVCPGCCSRCDTPWTRSSEELHVLELTGRADANGRPEYRFVFDEEGFNRFFEDWLAPWLPRVWDTPCRNVRIDLREGGMVVHADVDLDAGETEPRDSAHDRWQRVGAVVSPDTAGSRLVPLGLSIGEAFYDLPETGPLATAASEVETLVDETMDRLAIVGPLDGEAYVTEIAIAEDRLIVVMR